MSRFNEENISVEVRVDSIYGPIIRFTYREVTVSVYIQEEIAVVSGRNGQYGLPVTGPIGEFKDALVCIGENSKPKKTFRELVIDKLQAEYRAWLQRKHPG